MTSPAIAVPLLALRRPMMPNITARTANMTAGGPTTMTRKAPMIGKASINVQSTPSIDSTRLAIPKPGPLACGWEGMYVF